MQNENNSNERTLLGQILTDNTIFHSLEITENDFQIMDNKRIFKTISHCISLGLIADIITVSDKNDKINPGSLATLTTNIASTANWEYYHKRIIKSSYKEKIRVLSVQMVDWVKSETPDNVIKNIENALMEITNKTGKYKILKIAEIVPKFIDLIEKRYHNKGIPLGIQTGIYELDSMIIGFRKRMFYLIGGRPSQGKSALLLNFACHAGIRLNKKVGYISTESSVMEIITRLFASEGKVDSMKLITGKLIPRNFPRMVDVASKINDKNMYFHYKPGMTLDEVTQTARLMVRFYNCEIIYIDYIQDIYIQGNQTTIEKTAMKSKAMKYLAEELNIPVVAGAQLRRDAEERRPRLSDFSDSSQLEKDADCAILIHHHHVNKKTPEEKPEYKSYLLAEKVRDGITGQVPVQFVKEYVTFVQRREDETM